MNKRLLLAVVVLIVACQLPQAQTPGSTGTRGDADVVHVAPPTGETEADRASILAALERARPGGTIQFAPGTYLVGELIHVTAAGITIVGHPDGTILRGCDPSGFENKEFAVAECNGFSLTGGHQTVRDLTFEYTWHALILGGLECQAGDCPRGALPVESRTGGHVVEGNTFRESPNGIRVVGQWPEPAVIRANRFVNTYHAVMVNGMTAHILDNHISVPEPGRVPNTRHPGLPLMISGWEAKGMPACDRNMIAGNRIEGHPGAIAILPFPGGICRENVIRDNTIEIARVPFTLPSTAIHVHSTADSTVTGVPLALLNGVFGEGVIEDNLIEGNRILGAEGLAIEILGASGNRIVDNTIIGVGPRDPFPGNTLFPEAPEWREANGSGIWISPGSNGNEIVGNTFEAVAAWAIVLEGDGNRVELRSGDDAVRELGVRHEVSRPQPASGLVPEAPPDATRYVEIVEGEIIGEWLMWQEASDTWRYASARSHHFSRTGRLVLDAAGLPVRLDASGQMGVDHPWYGESDLPWFERFDLRDGVARWVTPRERGEKQVSEPAFYAAVHPAHDPGVLARALLRRETQALPLLPAGEARLETLDEKTVEIDGRSKTVRLHAIHGRDLLPIHVWLDEEGATFAEEWSILAGWEAVFPELRTSMDEAIAAYDRGLARKLAPPDRTRPLVVRNARLFDAETGRVRAGTTIVIEGNRIAAVGAEKEIEVPIGAEVIEARGHMVLPGLWDMHAHLSYPAEEQGEEHGQGPLHLAAGVTTVRDMGSPVEHLLSLREAVETGDALGPRVLVAGFVDGPVKDPGMVTAGNADEARAAVDRFGELGFPQVKIHAFLPTELVDVVIARAKEHGMRVSGHIVEGMTTWEAVDAGYDEIQHLWWLVWAIPWSNEEAMTQGETRDTWHQVLAELTPSSEPVRDLTALLATRGVAVDPTIGYFVSESSPPEFIAEVVGRLPAPVERRLQHKTWQPAYFPRSPLARSSREQALENMFGLLSVLHEAGVPIVAGSDTWPGFGLHFELELYVKAGIPAPEVLTLATLGAARIMRMDSDLGSVEPGKLADLILVDGDPTTDISDIRRVVTVVKDGRVYDPAAIYRALGIEPCCEQPSRGVDR